MGVVSGCGCKEVYRFPHTTYPYSSCIYLFFFCSKYVTEVYVKRDDFNFDIVNFRSNIPAKPTYAVYISQLIRICRICDNYSSFLLRHKLLTERLVRQGFWYNKLCITFKKFARRYTMY